MADYLLRLMSFHYFRINAAAAYFRSIPQMRKGEAATRKINLGYASTLSEISLSHFFEHQSAFLGLAPNRAPEEEKTDQMITSQSSFSDDDVDPARSPGSAVSTTIAR